LADFGAQGRNRTTDTVIFSHSHHAMGFSAAESALDRSVQTKTTRGKRDDDQDVPHTIGARMLVGIGRNCGGAGFSNPADYAIVPFSPGGSTDVTLRALAAATEKHLGQQILIENRPGGSATIGPAQMAATAKPDG
jgi:Tripartite tricarboxylate transporter family receptor